MNDVSGSHDLYDQHARGAKKDHDDDEGDQNERSGLPFFLLMSVPVTHCLR